MKNLQTLSNRIKYARIQRGLTQVEVAKLVGLTQQGYQDIEIGKSKRPRNIEKIAEVLKCSPHWLQFGDNETESNEEKSVPRIFVPIVTWQQITGNDDSFELKDENFLPMIGQGSSKTYVLKIKGDAMISPMQGKRSFNENEYIYVDPTLIAVNGDYVIALQKDAKEPYFKQYIVEGNKEYLRSLNPQYPIIELDESIIICGVVIGSYIPCRSD